MNYVLVSVEPVASTFSVGSVVEIRVWARFPAPYFGLHARWAISDFWNESSPQTDAP